MELSRVYLCLYLCLYSSGVNETGYSPKQEMTYMGPMSKNILWSD